MLDPNFATRLAVSRGRQMLQSHTASATASSEAKSENDDVAHVHDLRAAESTDLRAQSEATELPQHRYRAEAKMNSKTIFDDEEKPTWQQVTNVGSALNDASCLVDSAADLETELQLSNDLASTWQKQGDEHNLLGATSRHRDDDACVAAQTNVFQRSMNEALGEAAAVQQSRMDSLETKLEVQLSCVTESVSEQGRVLGDRLGELERTMQRIERMLLASSGTARHS